MNALGSEIPPLLLGMDMAGGLVGNPVLLEESSDVKYWLTVSLNGFLNEVLSIWVFAMV